MKQFIMKSEDPNIQLGIAVEYFGTKKSLGSWRGFYLYNSSSQGLTPTTFWYAAKDDVTYVDRGLAGLLDYIDKVDKDTQLSV